MNILTLTKHINAAPDKVFDVSTNLAALPTVVPTIKRVEVLTTGPVARGTRFRETRVMFGKDNSETMEFTDFSPPNGYTLSNTSCGVQSRFRFDIRPTSTGSDLTVSVDCTPVAFMAKVLSPLMGMMMKGTMRKCLDGDIECLKKAAEST
jgi:uncharacterized protein YndB with AHSA1/START domain